MNSATTAPGVRLKPTWNVPYYVKGLALGLPPYLVAIHMWTWVLVVPGVLARGGYDFRQLYAAGSMVRTGHANELYEYASQKEFQDKLISPEAVALPFVSPACEAVFVAPLSFFSYRTAYFVFLALNVAGLGLCFILLRPWMFNLRAVYPWLPASLFLGFLPVATALIEGQDSILLTTLLVAAFVLLTQRRVFFAGVLTGLGLFKFPITVPIALLFLVWRRRRFCLGFATSASALAIVSIWLTGARQAELYIDSLIAIAGLKTQTTWLALYPVNWRLMANVHGFVAGLAGAWLPNLWIQTFTILLSGVVLGWTALRGLRITDDSILLLLAIPCSLLIAHHTNAYDLSVLLLPMIVLLNQFLPCETNSQLTKRRIARASALMFVAPVMESFSLNHFYLVSLSVLLLLLACASASLKEDFLRRLECHP